MDELLKGMKLPAYTEADVRHIAGKSDESMAGCVVTLQGCQDWKAKKEASIGPIRFDDLLEVPPKLNRKLAPKKDGEPFKLVPSDAIKMRDHLEIKVRAVIRTMGIFKPKDVTKVLELINPTSDSAPQSMEALLSVLEARASTCKGTHVSVNDLIDKKILQVRRSFPRE